MNPGKTKCDGTTLVDTVLAGCAACKTVQDCEPGRTYLSKACDGSDLAINTCVVCGSKDCSAGFYSGGCGGLQPTQCLALTQCPAGKFLNKWSSTNDGECETCRNCVAEGKREAVACSALNNAGCGGEPCDASGRCSSGVNTARFCSFRENASLPVCGVCPVRLVVRVLGWCVYHY